MISQDQNKKKKQYKQKKTTTGWEKGKKKGGKSKNIQPNQSQLIKQNSYEA